MPTLSVFRAFCQAFHTIKDNPVLVLRLMIPVVVVQTLSFAPGIEPLTWLDVTITSIGLWLAGVLSVNIITLAVAGPDALPNPERAAWIPGVLALKVLVVQLALFLFAWLAVTGMLIGISTLASPFMISHFLAPDWPWIMGGTAIGMFMGGSTIFVGFLMFRARLRLIFAPVTMALRLSAPLDTSRHAAHGIIGKLFLLLCLAGALLYLPIVFVVRLYITAALELPASWSAAYLVHQTTEFIQTLNVSMLHVYNLQLVMLVMWIFTSAAMACAFRQIRDRDVQTAS